MNGFEVENKRISQERILIFLQYVLLWMIILQKIRENLENTEGTPTNRDSPEKGNSTNYDISDPNSVTGQFIGEEIPSEFIIFETASEAFKKLLNKITELNLMGKLWGEDGYVCINLVKDGLKILDIKPDLFFPGNDYVKDNLDKLKELDDVFELKPGDTLESGLYVFYKVYNNNIDGHTGFLYVDKNLNQTVLHNGYKPGGKESVNMFERGSTNFNNFFTKDKNNNVYIKEILTYEE